MSILSGRAILEACERGDIQVDPLRKEMINPASIDLTLGGQVLVYKDPQLDSKKEPRVEGWDISSEGILLRSGIGYLMHTAERVGSRRYVPVLDGKSSLGRLFVQVHATAGYGDPGFYGQWTLEVSVIRPVRVYPGMRFAQMRFHEVVGSIDPYEGNYKSDAEGPVPSRAWKQFK